MEDNGVLKEMIKKELAAESNGLHVGIIAHNIMERWASFKDTDRLIAMIGENTTSSGISGESLQKKINGILSRDVKKRDKAKCEFMNVKNHEGKNKKGWYKLKPNKTDAEIFAEVLHDLLGKQLAEKDEQINRLLIIIEKQSQ